VTNCHARSDGCGAPRVPRGGVLFGHVNQNLGAGSVSESTQTRPHVGLADLAHHREAMPGALDLSLGSSVWNSFQNPLVKVLRIPDAFSFTSRPSLPVLP